MEKSNKMIEIDDRFPNGAFIDGVFVVGEVIDGKFKPDSTLDKKASEAVMTDEQRIKYNYNVAQYMEECFPRGEKREWWKIAEYEFQLLQQQMVNGKRRIKAD